MTYIKEAVIVLLCLVSLTVAAQSTSQDSIAQKAKADSLHFKNVHTFGIQSNYNNILEVRTVYSYGVFHSVKTKYFTSVHNAFFVSNTTNKGFNWQHEVYTIPFNKIYYHFFYGISNSQFLPKFSAGGNLFINAGKGWEPTAGYRFMNFGANTNAHIISAGIGKYYKAYLLNYKLYLVPTSGSLTHTIGIRRYFKDVHFVELRAGYGNTISESVIQNNAGQIAKSNFVSLSGKMRFKQNIWLSVNGGFENFKTNSGRKSTVINAGFALTYVIQNAKIRKSN